MGEKPTAVDDTADSDALRGKPTKEQVVSDSTEEMRAAGSGGPRTVGDSPASTPGVSIDDVASDPEAGASRKINTSKSNL